MEPLPFLRTFFRQADNQQYLELGVQVGGHGITKMSFCAALVIGAKKITKIGTLLCTLQVRTQNVETASLQLVRTLHLSHAPTLCVVFASAFLKSVDVS